MCKAEGHWADICPGKVAASYLLVYFYYLQFEIAVGMRHVSILASTHEGGSRNHDLASCCPLCFGTCCRLRMGRLRFVEIVGSVLLCTFLLFSSFYCVVNLMFCAGHLYCKKYDLN